MLENRCTHICIVRARNEREEDKGKKHHETRASRMCRTNVCAIKQVQSTRE